MTHVGECLRLKKPELPCAAHPASGLEALGGAARLALVAVIAREAWSRRWDSGRASPACGVRQSVAAAPKQLTGGRVD